MLEKLTRHYLDLHVVTVHQDLKTVTIQKKRGGGGSNVYYPPSKVNATTVRLP